MYLTMHHTLPKRVLSMEKSLLEDYEIKNLVQGLQLIDIFHQLADK